MIPLKGAMTNEVFQIKWPTTHERSRKVLVRIYGKGVDIFFDRENEIKTFEFMSQKGQGPRLLARFSNGRVEEFIRARVHKLFLFLFFLFFQENACLCFCTVVLALGFYIFRIVSALLICNYREMGSISMHWIVIFFFFCFFFCGVKK